MMETAYIKGNSFIHKMDSRSKMICLLFSIILVFLPIELIGVLSFTLFMLFLSIFCAGIREGLRPIKLILPVLTMMVLLSPFYGSEGNVLLQIKGVNLLYESGALRVARLGSRFICLTLLFSLLIKTTTRNDMLSGFRSFGMPFQAALTVSLILRFIPTTAKTMNMINDSHIIRKIPGKKKNKFKEFIPQLISAIVYSLRSINPLGRTLSQRGLQLKNKRTRLHVLGNWKKPLFEICIFLFFSVPYVLIFWR